MLRSKQTASSKKRLVSPPFPPRGLFFLRISYFAFLFFYDKKQEGKFMQNTSIIRNAFMALTSLFLLTGCVSGDAKTGYDKSLSLMKSMLKDPDSMKIKTRNTPEMTMIISPVNIATRWTSMAKTPLAPIPVTAPSTSPGTLAILAPLTKAKIARPTVSTLLANIKTANTTFKTTQDLQKKIKLSPAKPQSF